MTGPLLAGGEVPVWEYLLWVGVFLVIAAMLIGAAVSTLRPR